MWVESRWPSYYADVLLSSGFCFVSLGRVRQLSEERVVVLALAMEEAAVDPHAVPDACPESSHWSESTTREMQFREAFSQMAFELTAIGVDLARNYMLSCSASEQSQYQRLAFLPGWVCWTQQQLSAITSTRPRTSG